MVVHWGGYPVDLPGLRGAAGSTCPKADFIPIIETAPRAGGQIARTSHGNHGNLACFSLQAIKLVTAVDGGVLITPSQSMFRRAKLLRWYGIDRDVPLQDMRCELDVPEWGYKFHMNDFAPPWGTPTSAIGIASGACKRITRITMTVPWPASPASRCWSGVRSLSRRAGSTHSAVTIAMDSCGDLRSGASPAAACTTGTTEHTYRVGPVRESLPQLDQVTREMLCIPVGWWVTQEQREYIAQVIREGW